MSSIEERTAAEWERIAHERESSFGMGRIGTSDAYWIADAYEKAGNLPEAAKYHLLSGYGLSPGWVERHHLSEGEVRAAAENALGRIERSLEHLARAGNVYRGAEGEPSIGYELRSSLRERAGRLRDQYRLRP